MARRTKTDPPASPVPDTASPRKRRRWGLYIPFIIALVAVGVSLDSVQRVGAQRVQQFLLLFALSMLVGLVGTWLIYIACCLTIWSMVYYLKKSLPDIRAKAR